jgi:hypothetical protein
MEALRQNPGPAAPDATRSLELPAPTSAPIVSAFGVSLVFAGLATHGLVATMGAILLLAGLWDWFKQVLPHPAHERAIASGEVSPVEIRRRGVEQVAVAQGLVRANLPLQFYPISAGVRGGAWGGVAMALLAVTYGLVSGHGVWYPINLLAAGFFPAATTAELLAFHAGSFGIACVIHVLTSLLVGVLYGAMLPLLPRRPILLGGLIGPLLWTGLLHSSLALINPTLASRIDWWWFVASQLGFGLVAGWVVSRRQRVPSAQPLPWQLRAGLEATGLIDETPSEGKKHV